VIIGKDRIPQSEAIVRRDGKFAYWPDYAYEELFDLTTDPAERRNLAVDPANSALLAGWRTALVLVREQAR